MSSYSLLLGDSAPNRGRKISNMMFFKLARLKLLHLMMALVLFCSGLYTARNWGLMKASSAAIDVQLTRECNTKLGAEARAREDNQPTLPQADVRLLQDEISNNLIQRLNLTELHQLSGNNSAIFFIETNPMIESFFSQPECAFESAALRNPGRPVIVLQDASARMGAFSRHLVKVDNLHFVKVDFKEITDGTPLEKLWQSPLSTNESQYHLNTVSDALRVVLMSHFGGAYLDSDIISRKSIPVGKDAYGMVVAEEDDRINNAVLIFHKDNKFVPLLLQEQESKIDGPDNWGILGPMAVTKVVKSVCSRVESPWWHFWSWSQPLAKQDCGEYLNILPTESAYPVDYRDWEQFFLPAGDSEVRKKWKGSFGVHLWNKMRFWGDTKRIVLCDDAPVFKLLNDNCPRTAAAKLAAAVGRNYGDV